jgi:hypothetical protein
MNVRIDNHVISVDSYQRFVLVERLEGAGGEHMIRVCSSCSRRAAVNSSLQSFPMTHPFHPFYPGCLEAVHDWWSEEFVLAIENILGWFRCRIVFAWRGARSAGGCPSCVIYSLDDGLYMGRPLVCVIWESKFLLLYCRKLRLVLAWHLFEFCL